MENGAPARPREGAPEREAPEPGVQVGGGAEHVTAAPSGHRADCSPRLCLPERQSRAPQNEASAPSARRWAACPASGKTSLSARTPSAGNDDMFTTSGIGICFDKDIITEIWT